MKNLFFVGVVAILFAFTSSAPAERSIGFATALPENKWHLGTEKAIQVVKDLDKAWVAKDYASMKSFFVDTAKCYFSDGKVAKSPAQFIEFVKAEDDGSEVSWTFDYAFSADLDPTRGGEHVQAGFTTTSVKGGVTTKNRIHESYYIIEGKIVTWDSFKMVYTED